MLAETGHLSTYRQANLETVTWTMFGLILRAEKNMETGSLSSFGIGWGPQFYFPMMQCFIFKGFSQKTR